MTLFGIDVVVRPLWLVVFVLMTWSVTLIAGLLEPPVSGAPAVALGVVAALLVFACVVLHELSHALVARRLGVPVGDITLFLFGGVASILREPDSARDEVLIASAGPLVSVLLGAMLYALSVALDALHVTWFAQLALILALWNVVLAVFNLIPAFPTDGGRLLRAAIWFFARNRPRATVAAALVGALVSLALVAIGVWLTWTHRDWRYGWWAVLGVFLLNAAFASLRQARFEMRLERLRVGQCMFDALVPVPADATIYTFVTQLVRDREAGYPVVDDGSYLGLMTLGAAGDVPSERWNTTTVRQVMAPAADVPMVRADMSAGDALAWLARTGQPMLPVADGERIAGVVSRQSIYAALRARADDRAAA